MGVICDLTELKKKKKTLSKIGISMNKKMIFIIANDRNIIKYAMILYSFNSFKPPVIRWYSKNISN